MKKNLISVIILALVFANFVLTAILMFTVFPQTQKANEMITKVCEAIDLDLNSGAATGLSNLPVDKMETYNIAAGETMTVNLKDGGYLVVAVAISVNKECDYYKENTTAILTSQEPLIKSAVIEILESYTKDELNAGGKETAKNEILTMLRNTFDGEYIVGISFPTYMFG